MTQAMFTLTFFIFLNLMTLKLYFYYDGNFTKNIYFVAHSTYQSPQTTEIKSHKWTNIYQIHTLHYLIRPVNSNSNMKLGTRKNKSALRGWNYILPSKNRMTFPKTTVLRIVYLLCFLHCTMSLKI